VARSIQLYRRVMNPLIRTDSPSRSAPIASPDLGLQADVQRWQPVDAGITSAIARAHANKPRKVC